MSSVAQKSHSKQIPNGRKISVIFGKLPDNFSSSRVTVGEIKDALPGKSYGVLLLLLAIPNLAPVPAPGLSALVGAPLFLITLQLMAGLKTPMLPKFIARRGIKRADLKRVCSSAIPYLEKVEFFIKPRLDFLVNPPADRFMAFICVMLSVMIMLPVPFGNALPALAICFFALGLIQHDGVFIILGMLVALICASMVFALADFMLF